MHILPGYMCTYIQGMYFWGGGGGICSRQIPVSVKNEGHFFSEGTGGYSFTGFTVMVLLERFLFSFFQHGDLDLYGANRVRGRLRSLKSRE